MILLKNIHRFTLNLMMPAGPELLCGSELAANVVVKTPTEPTPPKPKAHENQEPIRTRRNMRREEEERREEAQRRVIWV